MKVPCSLLRLLPPNVIMLRVSCRNFWVRLILGMMLNAVKSLKRTPHHLNCEFNVFYDQAITCPTLKLT